MTTKHPISKNTARILCAAYSALPLPGASAVVALSTRRTKLHLVNTGTGFELSTRALPADQWVDEFGLLPYTPGRVALTTSPVGAWARSLERVRATA